MEALFPTVGVHHITLIGSNKRETVAFWRDTLGMPLLFEQPNLDVPEELHLYFDPGDGRLITFFVRESRVRDPNPLPEVIGGVHHLAFAVTRETYDRAADGLGRMGYPNSGRVDRGFMDSLYFRDPNGLLIELAVYKFAPPAGHTVVDVLALAHRLRLEAGEYAIADEHVQAAVQQLAQGVRA